MKKILTTVFTLLTCCSATDPSSPPPPPKGDGVVEHSSQALQGNPPVGGVPQYMYDAIQSSAGYYEPSDKCYYYYGTCYQVAMIGVDVSHALSNTFSWEMNVPGQFAPNDPVWAIDPYVIDKIKNPYWCAVYDVGSGTYLRWVWAYVNGSNQWVWMRCRWAPGRDQTTGVNRVQEACDVAN